MSHHISTAMQSCIDNCSECSNTCLQMVNHCLGLGGRHAEQKHIQLLAVCAEICRTSAAFMSLGSEHYQDTCRICADICEECARDCDRFGDDEHMRECAEVCRRCVESCQEMAVAGRH